MCSCLNGTQNAVLLSVSSRRTDCKHTAALLRSLVASGVSVGRFAQRMRLGINAADFAAARQYGPSVVWTVLYQTVFFLVTFSAGNLAACVAPGCRRFQGRCGHVRVARPLNSEFKAQAAADALANPRPPEGPNEVPASNERATFIISPDEDQGVGKLPCDTARDKGDSQLHQTSRRVPRNMLSCVGETEDCAAWARTADLRRVLYDRASCGRDGQSGHWKLMGQLLASLKRRGLARDVMEVLAEGRCGSCGTKRQEWQQLVRKPANLYTDHPTAPVLHVRPLPVSLCSSGILLNALNAVIDPRSRSWQSV